MPRNGPHSAGRSYHLKQRRARGVARQPGRSGGRCCSAAPCHSRGTGPGGAGPDRSARVTRRPPAPPAGHSDRRLPTALAACCTTRGRRRAKQPPLLVGQIFRQLRGVGVVSRMASTGRRSRSGSCGRPTRPGVAWIGRCTGPAGLRGAWFCAGGAAMPHSASACGSRRGSRTLHANGVMKALRETTGLWSILHSLEHCRPALRLTARAIHTSSTHFQVPGAMSLILRRRLSRLL